MCSPLRTNFSAVLHPCANPLRFNKLSGFLSATSPHQWCDQSPISCLTKSYKLGVWLAVLRAPNILEHRQIGTVSAKIALRMGAMPSRLAQLIPSRIVEMLRALTMAAMRAHSHDVVCALKWETPRMDAWYVPPSVSLFAPTTICPAASLPKIHQPRAKHALLRYFHTSKCPLHLKHAANENNPRQPIFSDAFSANSVSQRAKHAAEHVRTYAGTHLSSSVSGQGFPEYLRKHADRKAGDRLKHSMNSRVGCGRSVGLHNHGGYVEKPTLLEEHRKRRLGTTTVSHAKMPLSPRLFAQTPNVQAARHRR